MSMPRPRAVQAAPAPTPAAPASAPTPAFHASTSAAPGAGVPAVAAPAPAAATPAAATPAAATSAASTPAAPVPPRPRPVVWYDLPTPAGRFTLSPVKPERDLPLLHRWMNDPAVAEYWLLDGPPERTAEYVHGRLALGHTQPLLARLSGRPIGYWELYQAAEDPLAAYYQAEPDDLGVHLLIGEADCRGIGLGRLLLRALADAAQRRGPRRLVAEPDARNLASLRAFAGAGFTAAAALDLPDKRATLMLRPAPGREAR